MLKIVGNDVMRGVEKVGYVQGNDIHDRSGHKVGYSMDNHVFDHTGHKLARLEGDHIKDVQGNVMTSVSENHNHVSGGALSDLSRAAVRVLLGD